MSDTPTHRHDRALVIEERLWKPRENDLSPSLSGFRNFWIATDGPAGKHLRQTAGINPVAVVKGFHRRPAVAIFLTPAGERHRLPWLDEVDLDSAFIRYFGDNKPELQVSAERAAGNNVLLAEMNSYAASDRLTRLKAAPLLFFRNLGSSEGLPLTEFLGFGLIREAHRVTQIYKGATFSNYAFDCVLFNGDENEEGTQYLDMRWIDSRRAAIPDEATLGFAPSSWKRWIDRGAAAIEDPRVRRFVFRRDVLPPDEQVPELASPLGKVLEQVYRRYDGNQKHGFQALAYMATKQVVMRTGLDFQDGWVTPRGPDGGVDFVQRLDVGRGFASASLGILGQAKCKKPWSTGSGISGEDLARVVARLQRGWIGAYVTTSYFTQQAQRELIVDKYPILLIAGKQLAEVVEEMRDGLGYQRVGDLLESIDSSRYGDLVRASRPNPMAVMQSSPAFNPWAGAEDLVP